MKQIISPREVEEMATLAVDAAFAVHKELGPGLLESAYEACFAHELDLRGVRYQRQLPVPLTYKGKLIEVGFRADVIIEQKL
jgi:GxxExxY protein